MKLPQARNENLVVQAAGSELLVYDLVTNKAYNLNETSKIVFSACGNKASFDELKSRHNYTDELIYLALDELRRNNLLAGEVEGGYPRMSRREAAKRVGLGTMIALPLIISLVAPRAASAQSRSTANGLACQDDEECRSRRCTTTRFVTGTTIFVDGGKRCCVAGGGDYLNVYFAPPGNCNFAANCCTGSGTETSPSSCACDATS